MAKNLFYHIKGLGDNFADQDFFDVSLNGDNLEINQIKVRFGKRTILQSYRINAQDILMMDIVSVEQLKNKSVVGRGVAGGLLFGPLGAVIGGMSGINKQKIKRTLVIIYLPSQRDEPQEFILDIDVPSWGSLNEVSINKLKKELTKIPKSQRAKEYLKIFEDNINEDGSIQL